MSHQSLVRRVAFLGDYVPRLCGIATFTHDLCEAVSKAAPESECYVGAVNDRAAGYDYPADVRARAMPGNGDAGNRALEFEQRIYLHDQLLRDTDQMAMAAGLEIRAPLLDTDLAQACAAVSSDIKASRGLKGLLVAAAEKATGLKFPREITARRKQGFMLPLEKWSGR